MVRCSDITFYALLGHMVGKAYATIDGDVLKR